VLVLGDPKGLHAVGESTGETSELKARLIERYMEFVRSQNSFHVRSTVSCSV
jgi:hypothetical protein